MAVRLKGRKRGGPAVPETVGYVVNSSPGSAMRRAIGVQPVVAPAAGCWAWPERRLNAGGVLPPRAYERIRVVMARVARSG
jgi:hypothetical protein